LCRQGRNLDAIEKLYSKLYSPNIVSIESVGDETTPPEMHGIEAALGKNLWWFDNHEIRGSQRAVRWRSSVRRAV
jgi:hypothetical protein